MPKYGGSIWRAIDDNSRQKCKLSSCQQRRWRVSGYCLKHDRANKAWGHPCGSNLKDRDLVDYFDTVSAIIDANLSHHKGIQAGVQFFKLWMMSAANQAGTDHPTVFNTWHLARLHHAGVNPVDLLKVVASVWLYHETNQGRCGIYSDKHCLHVMGHKVLKFLPILQKKGGQLFPTGKERKTAGKHIQDSIGVLLVNIAQTAKQQMQREHARLSAMGGYLEVPTNERNSMK